MSTKTTTFTKLRQGLSNHGDQDFNVPNDIDENKNVCVAHNTEVDGFMNERLRNENVTNNEDPYVLKSRTQHS